MSGSHLRSRGGSFWEPARIQPAPSPGVSFTVPLSRKRAASQNTIAAFGLTFRLLLQFTSARSGIPPSKLDIADLDAPLVAAFLEHLARERGNATATRDARLAAIHPLFPSLPLPLSPGGPTPTPPLPRPGCHSPT